MGYDINSDPYLSDKFKNIMSKIKADGGDLSLVDRWLAETAPIVARTDPLLAPLHRHRIWPVVAFIVGVCGLICLCVLFP